MTRIVLGGLAATILLLLPATAQGHSGARLRGTVMLTDTANHVVTVRSSPLAVALRVPGSLALIRVGQRVELRGTTLRRHGNGSRVLARGVTIASSQPLASPASARDEAEEDDEVEVKGTLTSLSPLIVVSGTRTVMCTVPPGMSLAGFTTGDFVEITCDLTATGFVLRELEHEDQEGEDQADRDDDGGHSGPGGGGDDDGDHGHSGHGGGGDD